MTKSLLVFSLVAVCFVFHACQQTIWDTPTYQKITISKDGKLIEFRVTDVKAESNPKNEYWWYNGKEIMVTKGGYTGLLLDSDYAVKGVDGSLQEQGTFKEGIKTGIWIYWTNSKLAKRMTYKNGLLDGEYNEFSNGILNLEGVYKEGVRDGKFFYYHTDTTLVQVYDQGKLIVKDEE